MRLIDADVLEEKFCELEAQALIHVGKINERDGDKFSEEWKIWSAILQERTAFKHDVFDSPTIDINKWVPVSEGLPIDCILVLVTYLDEDVNFPIVDIGYRTSRGFCDRDFNEIDVIAWQPLPKPYEVKEK